MNVALVVAGLLALLGAAVHGVAGELLVVRKLSRSTLPSSRLGGPGMTKAMIHVTWQMATVGFLTVACALLLAGTVLDGEAARAAGVVAAGAATGFAAIAVGLGAAYARSPRTLLRHPGAAVLTVTAVVAWWGVI